MIEYTLFSILFRYFEMQLQLASQTQLPMFLHDRNTKGDFIAILSKLPSTNRKGVVHCFTGTDAELKLYLDHGLYIGVTGASFKTAQQVATMKKIPAERLLIETDAPYCGIVPKYEGYKYINTKIPFKQVSDWTKGFPILGRNEPCHIVQVLEVLSNSRNEDAHALATTIYNNTTNLFFP